MPVDARALARARRARSSTTSSLACDSCTTVRARPAIERRKGCYGVSRPCGVHSSSPPHARAQGPLLNSDAEPSQTCHYAECKRLRARSCPQQCYSCSGASVGPASRACCGSLLCPDPSLAIRCCPRPLPPSLAPSFVDFISKPIHLSMRRPCPPGQSRHSESGEEHRARATAMATPPRLDG